MNGPFNITLDRIVNRRRVNRQIRTGVTTSVVEEFAESRSDRVVSTNIAQSMRARDITVTGENFKPNTPYFVFFDGIDVNDHMTPTSATYGMGGATSKGTKLRSDNLGAISATFSIPNTDALSFTTGDKTLKISSDSTGNPSLSEGFSTYSADGQIRVVQEEIVSTRNGRIVTDEVSDERQQVRWVDPLAQSFLVDKKGGIFVSSVEIYFGAKDTALPVSVQIRHMENGSPTQKILPFGDKTLNPSSVSTSADGSTATKFTFDSPVYLESGREYCAVVMSNSNVYTCWVSEMGQKDIKTNDFIDQQPYAGSLFKSQNNSTWTPDQMKDLKMTINRCKFTTGTTANVVFENDSYGTESLQNNPIETVSGTKMFKVYHYSHGNYDEKLSNITISGVTGDRTGSVLRFTDDTIESTSGDDATDSTVTGIVGSGGTGTGIVATLTTVGDDSTAIVITNPGQGYTVGDDITFQKNSKNFVFDVAEVGETLGGIPVAYINRTHTAGTAVAETTAGSAMILNDIDSYLITIPDSVWAVRSSNTGINYQSATESTTGGGSAVTATGNVYFDTIHTTIPSLELPKTSITTTFKGTSATQPIVLSSGRVVSYTKDTTSNTITLNDNNSLLVPKIIASSINETNEMGGNKSFELSTQLSSTQDNVSPVLDVDSMGIIGIQNRINNSDGANSLMMDNTSNFTNASSARSTYVNSTEARGDTNASVYCTKQVVLQNPANAIHVFFDGYKAVDTNGVAAEIDVYYKVLGPDSNLQFVDKGWVLATIKNAVPADGSDFREHEYEIESLEDFTTFSIKIVLKSHSTANVPLLENFRAIALST